MERQSYLVLRAQCGDRQALNELLERVAPELHRYIARIAQDESLADDVLQDVLIQICRKIGHLREPRIFRFWAFRIANRMTIRSLRRRRKDLSFDDSLAANLGDPKAFSEMQANLKKETVESLLKSLSPASRAVLSLHYLNGLTISELADVLEIPIGTAKSRLAYGITKLRKQHKTDQSDSKLR